MNNIDFILEEIPIKDEEEILKKYPKDILNTIGDFLPLYDCKKCHKKTYDYYEWENELDDFDFHEEIYNNFYNCDKCNSLLCENCSNQICNYCSEIHCDNCLNFEESKGEVKYREKYCNGCVRQLSKKERKELLDNQDPEYEDDIFHCNSYCHKKLYSRQNIYEYVEEDNIHLKYSCGSCIKKIKK